MEISRLVFSKETKEKMEKGLNPTQRGVLRWSKVKESEADGRLSRARNRNEVANLAGFTYENRARGYQWVSNMVGRGYLREVVLGMGKDRKMEYEYHILGDPDYSRDIARRARAANQQRKIAAVEQTRPVMQINEVPSADISVHKVAYSVEVTRGDTTIKVELMSYEEVSDFVKTILKGE